MAELSALCDDLEIPRRAPGTIVAYESDWKHFKLWCADSGSVPLPASAKTLEFYVAWLMKVRNKRVSTAARRIAAVCYFHRLANVPVPDVARARRKISAVRRDRKEKPMRKAPLHPLDLPQVLSEDGTMAGARNRALLLLGFATSLRRSDLALIEMADVTFVPQGAVILIRRSKTDQDEIGRLVPVWHGAQPVTDPVSALRQWIAARGDWEGALFCRIRADDKIVREGITGESICAIIKRAAESAGFNPSDYGAHSLRRGSITTAADLGSSDQQLMNHSGHATAAVMRMYVDRSRVFSRPNPLAGAL